MTKQDYMKRLLSELGPSYSSRELARIAQKRWPDIFSTSEKARDALRYVTGSHGEKSRKDKQRIEDEAYVFNDKDRTNSQFLSNVDGTAFLTTRSADITTLEEALVYAEVDLDRYEVDHYLVNSWEVTMGARGTKDKPQTYTNYQVKVWLKPKNPFDPEKFKQMLIDSVAKTSKSKTKITKYPSRTDNLLFLSINDLHLGRQSWGPAHGKDMDIDIIEENFNNSFDRLISPAIKDPPEQILLHVGNDLFTYDYAYPYTQTEHGTPQNADDRWQKLFVEGNQMVSRKIKELAKIAPVFVQVIPGNHDPQTMFFMGEVLKATFYNDLAITIDNAPRRRKYFHYGQNIIGGSHGNKERLSDWHAIFSAETKHLPAADYWYMYSGHMHHEKEVKIKAVERYQGVKMNIQVQREDYKGLIVDYFPSIAYKDGYEVSLGFVGTIASAKAALHNKRHGRVATFNYNLGER